MDVPPNAQVSNLLEDIARAGTSYGQHEPGARDRLLSLAYSLAAAVELPSETIQRIGWAEVSYARACGKEIPVDLMSIQPARFASTRIAVDLSLFDILEEKKDTGITTAELAKASNADPTLICKVLKDSFDIETFLNT